MGKSKSQKKVDKKEKKQLKELEKAAKASKTQVPALAEVSSSKSTRRSTRIAGHVASSNDSMDVDETITTTTTSQKRRTSDTKSDTDTQTKRPRTEKAPTSAVRVRRLSPAVITGDFSEESTAPPPGKKGPAAAPPVDGESNPESTDNDEEVEESTTSDLQKLGQVKLKAKLVAERPQFSNTRSKPISREEKTLPTINAKILKRESTPAPATVKLNGSESSSESDSNSDSESTSSSDSDSSSSSDDSEPDSKEQVTSKRGKARQKEAAKWSKKSGSDTKSKAKRKHAKNVNKGWHKDSHYIPLPSSSSNSTIRLKDQPKCLHDALDAAFIAAIGYSLFDNAFPSPLTVVDIHCKLFRDTTKELGSKYRPLGDRAKDDDDFMTEISKLLNSRVTDTRLGVKKDITDIIRSHFCAETEDNIPALKAALATLAYIYPSTRKGKIDRQKPYEHPCFIQCFKKAYFSGTSRKNIAKRHAARFPKTPADENLSEMPIPMVALIGTIVHATIDVWLRNPQAEELRYKFDDYEHTYRSHEEYIRSLKKEDSAGYHSMMAKLFSLASPQSWTSATSLAQAARAFKNEPVSE
ncbi:hypothetical protein CPB83DRAFT_894366 [Crepidotus variabilis]|uniref:DUF6532 domain-containing protein n=1 Tax=Crepidotus variabilis TaxID=179855 RepID=A0A9P6EGI3_9AGAR|nr:hypothetical protein CPB83DRAFT_894366 [Crepidotus variabilis]